MSSRPDFPFLAMALLRCSGGWTYGTDGRGLASLLVVIVDGVVGGLGAALAGEPGVAAAFTRQNPWQCCGFSLGAALIDRHREDRHIVALLALISGVAVDVGEDRLDD